MQAHQACAFFIYNRKRVTKVPRTGRRERRIKSAWKVERAEPCEKETHGKKTQPLPFHSTNYTSSIPLLYPNYTPTTYYIACIFFQRTPPISNIKINTCYLHIYHPIRISLYKFLTSFLYKSPRNMLVINHLHFSLYKFLTSFFIQVTP